MDDGRLTVFQKHVQIISLGSTKLYTKSINVDSDMN